VLGVVPVRAPSAPAAKLRKQDERQVRRFDAALRMHYIEALLSHQRTFTADNEQLWRCECCLERARRKEATAAKAILFRLSSRVNARVV
jgi:hypothetical protein